MRTAAFLLAGLLVWTARAEAPAGPSVEAAAQLEGQVCQSICRRRYETCAASSLAAEVKGPICETDVVVCSVNCPACLATFSTCVRGKGGDAKTACQAPFAACMSANGSSSRPLIRFAGGDGATQAQAVVVTGARNEDEGIVAELVWAGKTHPTWQKDNQVLVRAGGKAYDKIVYSALDGAHESWFDITAFFGKM